MTKPQPASGATVLHVTRVKKAGQARAPLQLAQAEPGVLPGEQQGVPEATAATGADSAAPAAEGGLGFWGWAGIVGGGAALLAAAGDSGTPYDAPPELTGSTPADNATAVPMGDNIVLTFSEPMRAGTGNIVISNGFDRHTISVTDTTQVTISGDTVTINPANDLLPNSTYRVLMASGVLTDRAGHAYAGLVAISGPMALDFATLDLIAPALVGSTPSDNATAVLVGGDIVLVFSEAMAAGSGDIIISNGTDTRTISVTDATQVSFSGNTVTINPAADLQSNTTYQVQMASGVLQDVAGNAFAGITASTALNFDMQDLVAPTLTRSTPADNVIDVQVGSNIVLTFDEPVMAGTGDIVISSSTDTRTISVTDATQVTVSGNTVTINPAVNLQAITHYSVQLASGVFQDLAGNPFAGILGTTALDFHTTGVELSAVAMGSGGFQIVGQGIHDHSGFSVSAAGDVNGDGLGDLLIGAPASDTAAGSLAGRSYVVFGKTTGAVVNLTAVAAGNGGFVISGQSAYDRSGFSVSNAGDVNGDGLADLIVGSINNSPATGTYAGSSYVVFGKASRAAVELSAVASGIGGFVINGETASDVSGFSVSSAGDMNGDGLADLIVGAPYSNVAGKADAGRTYVVFGKSTGVAVQLSALAGGTDGFVINGMCAGDLAGKVASVGDINGDGLVDLVVGAVRGDPAAGANAGRSYVVFGNSAGTTIDLSAVSAGSGGFVINGQCAGDSSGGSLSGVGDVNGDGLADLVIGAYQGDPAAGANAGRSYVVFGRSESTAIELSDVAAGSGGFVINGRKGGDQSGISVSGAGDVNGDGLADLIVGAFNAKAPAGDTAGRSFVVYGKSTGAAIDLSAVATGSHGFVINGQCAGDWSGVSVSGAGDVNGDGLADLIVGAEQSDAYSYSDTGRSYVIFGSTGDAFARTAVDQLGTGGADSFGDDGVTATLVTGAGNDTLTATAASILYGGAGSDAFVIDAVMIAALQSAFGAGGNTNRLSRIDGGTGIDTLSLSGAGLTLDLTRVANQAATNPDGGSRIDSIEKVDLTGTGDNTLVLQLLDVLDMGSANTFLATGRQQLLVTGNAGDTLDVADGAGTTGWTQSGTASIGAVSYNAWNHDTSLATIYVNPSITVV